MHDDDKYQDWGVSKGTGHGWCLGLPRARSVLGILRAGPGTAHGDPQSSRVVSLLWGLTPGALMGS